MELIDDLFSANSDYVSDEASASKDLPWLQEKIECGLEDTMRELVMSRMRWWAESVVAPRFWNFFEGHGELLKRKRRHNKDKYYNYDQLLGSLKYAVTAFSVCIRVASIFDAKSTEGAHLSIDGKSNPELMQWVIEPDESFLKSFCRHFRCAIFYKSSRHQIFDQVLETVFCLSLTTYSGMPPVDVYSVLELIDQLEWSSVVEPVLIRLQKSRIKQKIAHISRNNFGFHLIAKVEQWALCEIIPWIESLMQVVRIDTMKISTIVQINLSIRQGFVRHYISELFDIIKEYPDSIAALEDLSTCLSKPKEKQHLYLRNRKDTIRRIMVKLTDAESEGIVNDLQGENMIPIQHFDYSDDDEDIDPDEWMPECTLADPTNTIHSRRSDDILQILVNIYGSKEMFVNEYKAMLADRLLQALNYSTEKDMETLELLRLRFQENGLRDCQVMIRDMEDSRRINSNIQSLADGSMQKVDAAILSGFFWPPLLEESFATHPKTKGLIEGYKNRYHTLKTPRSLHWISLLGSVELSIELNGVERDLTVSPIEATIIQHFEEKETWLLSDLACAMEIHETILLKNMKIWMNLGILDISTDRSMITLGTTFHESLAEICFSSQDKPTAICTTAQAQQDLKVCGRIESMDEDMTILLRRHWSRTSLESYPTSVL
uniref:Anaphasepromoting complex subunit putative n=1 Tax=Albugo laibachii Nc14 TaxID=890382 RepID=F0W8B3_9STRA|nr:anaphasepromoting complex subunit putative [Albugo laibachii Nc14]|eukprot:CCA17313.1 anaphasepromoting complex subunit putative [Albugo laibachii Nc14]